MDPLGTKRGVFAVNRWVSRAALEADDELRTCVLSAHRIDPANA